MTNLVILGNILLLWVPATLVILHNLVSDLYFWQARGYQMRKIYSSLRWDSIHTHRQRIYYVVKLLAFACCASFLVNVLNPLPVLGIVIAFSLWFNQVISLSWSQHIPIKFQAFNLIPLTISVIGLTILPVLLALPLFATPQSPLAFEVAGLFPQVNAAGVIQVPAIYIFLIFSTLLAITYDLGSPLIISVAVLLSKPLYGLFNQLLAQNIATTFNKYPKLTKVVILGSYGKTTTKQFVWQLLQSKYKLAVTHSDISNLASLYELSKHVTNKTDVLVADLSLFDQRQARKLIDLIKPQQLVVIGTDASQIALFGSIDQLLSTYQSAVEVMPANGTIILNGENEALNTLSERTDFKEVIFYSHNRSSAPSADNMLVTNNLYLTDLNNDGNQISGQLHTNSQRLPITIPATGEANIASMLAAIAVALEMNIPMGEIAADLPKLHFAKHNLEIAKGDNNSTLVYDLHATNLQRFENAIHSAAEYSQAKKILITGGMHHLGRFKRHHYRQSLAKIVKDQFQYVIATDKLLVELLQRDNTHLSIEYVRDADAIIDKVAELTSSQTLIMVLGDVDPKIVTYLSAND